MISSRLSGSRDEKLFKAVVKTAFQFEGGLLVPAVTFLPKDATKAPVLLVGDAGRGGTGRKLRLPHLVH